MTPIEYIGPAPKKKSKRRPVIGGWVIAVLTCAFFTYFAWPSLANYLEGEQNKPSAERVLKLVTKLNKSSSFGDQLAAAALSRTIQNVIYDDSVYNNIGYPMGDVPSDRGNNADVVIRSYRMMNIDLQQLVHEDMKQEFHAYPKLWDSKRADWNIDHRRVKNLERYFLRNADSIDLDGEIEKFANGDIVVWRKPNGNSHIGIIVPGPGIHENERWVVHSNSDISVGPSWNNQLLDNTIVGHFRFDSAK